MMGANKEVRGCYYRAMKSAEEGRGRWMYQQTQDSKHRRALVVSCLQPTLKVFFFF